MTLPEAILPITFALIVFIDALTDKWRKDKVKHFRGAIVYAIVCGIVGLIFWQVFDERVLDITAFVILTRLAFFDPLYNLLIKQSFVYEGSKLPKEDISTTDILESLTGISIFWLRISYIAFYIGYLISYLL